MLTIDNFESAISATIVERGKNYFENDAVVSLEENSSGVWTAIVEGTEMYEVEVVLKGRKIKDHYCDCPYDGGAVCKHAVAVFYSLQAQLEQPVVQPAKSAKMSFEDVLLKTNLEELRAFIRHQKQQNRQFGDQFMLFFAEKDPKINKKDQYEGLVRQIIRNNSRRGFMDSRQITAFLKEMKPVLQAGITAVSQKNYRDALAIGQVICREVMPLILDNDDSSGRIVEVVNSALELFTSIANADTVSPELLDQLFNFIEKDLSEKRWFSHDDLGYELLEVAEQTALRIQPERYIRLLDTLVKIHSDKYENYRQEHFKKSKIEFYKAIGRSEEAEKLTAENIDIVEVRQSVVQKAIEKGDFARAKQLVAEGIQIAEQKTHPGTVHQWEVVLLDIARKEKNLGAEQHFTKKFAFERGFNAKYYKQWKATFPPAGWATVFESHIQSVIHDEKAKPRAYKWDTLERALYQRLAPIFIQEEKWAQLFEVATNTGLETVIEAVHPYLCKHYPAELLVAYLNLLENAGERASTRSEYHEMAALMKLVKKDIVGSHAAINDLAHKLMKQYPRRPAMLEELSSVLEMG